MCKIKLSLEKDQPSPPYISLKEITVGMKLLLLLLLPLFLNQQKGDDDDDKKLSR